MKLRDVDAMPLKDVRQVAYRAGIALERYDAGQSAEPDRRSVAKFKRAMEDLRDSLAPFSVAAAERQET